MSVDTAIITTVIPTLAGVGTGLFAIIWGVHTYKQGQVAKRQEILFPLIEEFNNKCNTLASAKSILDDIAIPPQSSWEKSNSDYGIVWEDIQGDYRPIKDFLEKELKLDWVKNQMFTRNEDVVSTIDGIHSVSLKLIRDSQNMVKTEITVDGQETYYFIHRIVNDKINLLWYYYHISNLQSILRDHSFRPITDEGETSIRESFDALLDFFGKLGYLIKIGLMTKGETLYFQYYIQKVVNNDAIMNYVKVYEFELFTLLIEQVGLATKEPQALHNL